MSLMMIMYEGRMMSTEEVLRIKNSKKSVIETPSEDIVEEVSDEIIETPQEENQEVVNDELEQAREEYKNLFGRKAHPETKLETLKEKIAKASEA